MPTSYKPEFKVFGDPKFYSNVTRFATKEEAEQAASSRFAVWAMAEDYRVTESDDPVNRRRVDGIVIWLDLE